MGVFEVINEVFQALFFSQYGSIFGLLLFVVLCMVIMMIRYELVFITFISTVFLFLEYFDYIGSQPVFVWNIIILLVFALMQLLFFAKKMREGR